MDWAPEEATQAGKVWIVVMGKDRSLPGAAVADDLHVDVIAGLVLVKGLDELLVHPRVELAHPGNFVRSCRRVSMIRGAYQRVRADSFAEFCPAGGPCIAGAGGNWPSIPPPLMGVEPSGRPLLFCGNDISVDVSF